jgi:2-keto-4-pentenoate hydratase/2-oxohepta-3-ene-1,7-dioic acid hydratase in catechol pathway
MADWWYAGVGSSFNKYLMPGTTMEVEISKIGTLRNTVEFA